MHIRIINPNTTASMTAAIHQAAQQQAGTDTTVSASQPDAGPVSIESHFDEVISAVGVAEEVLKGEREGGIDAYVVACFGDPGLLAARELRPCTGNWHCRSGVSLSHTGKHPFFYCDYPGPHRHYRRALTSAVRL